MISKTGIKIIYLTERGKLLTAPVYEFFAGLRDKSEMVISDFNPLKTIRGVHLPVLKNFKISGKTYQATLENLAKFLYYVSNGGCEAQIVAQPQSAAASSGGVFNFNGDNFLGTGFKFLINNKERSLAFDLEMATDIYEASNILTQSLLNSIIGEAGVNRNLYYAPHFHSLSFNSVNVFNKDELIEWSFAMETKETEKTAYNRSKVDYLKLNISAKGTDATITKVITAINTNTLSSLIFRSKVAESIEDVFTINANVIAQKEEVTIGDDTRNMLVSWEAEVPIANVSVGGSYHTLTITAE